MINFQDSLKFDFGEFNCLVLSVSIILFFVLILLKTSLYLFKLIRSFMYGSNFLTKISVVSVHSVQDKNAAPQYVSLGSVGSIYALCQGSECRSIAVLSRIRV